MTDSPVTGRSRSGTADSPMTGRTRSGPTVVRPQQVTEQSLMESVAGFINEVQSYNQPSTDPKSQIIWARFEHTDINDPSLFPQNQDVNGNSVPLLLVLGYNQGIQVWCIQGSGEAQLVLSWFHGQVKCLKILPTPEAVNPFTDPFSPSRPLVAICDSSGAGPAFMSVSFISLATGEQVSSIKFNSEIVDIIANKRVVCVAFREKVAVFSALTFREKFTLTSCYASPGVHSNPLALHSRWLAFSDKTLCHARRSSGGMEGDISQSTVTAWGINVGSKLASGVAKVCSNIFSGSTKPATSPDLVGDGERGVITVLDTMSLSVGEDELGYDLQNQKLDGVVAHFVAHNKAIVALEFDPSGSLLLTADKPGNSFNLFRIVAHPLGSAYAAVHHLYSLYRGDTPGSVQDIAFSADSRWVTVSTLRGTTHIFPISPYGGPVGVRTHTSHRVVNKLSRFHRSAGLNENIPSTSSGRNSPNPNLGSSPAANKSFEFPAGMGGTGSLAYPSPHLPPYPTPTLIQPVAQLRQPYIVTITNSVTIPGNRKSLAGKKNSAPEENPVRVVAAFAPSRARNMTGLHPTTVYRNTRKAADSLFVMANHGQLLEYSLEPVHDQTIPRDKVCESSPIQLHVTAYGQWNLFKPVGKERIEVAPPLSSTNPLLLSRPLFSPGEDEGWMEDEEEEEERWLSQVEILTHIGPARRLWMGPQFSFRPFQKPGEEDELKDLDVTVACRPKSEPMQMPGGGMLNKKPVYIECGSANSFELSPRFANAAVRGSQEQVHLDLEKELNEAMSDTVSTKLSGEGEGRHEEFFSISTEDVSRSRSRSGSTVSHTRSRHSSAIHRGVEMVTAESKIFSVAVQPGKSQETHNYVYKDMENQMIDRPVVLAAGSALRKVKEYDSSEEYLPVFRDPSLLEDIMREEVLEQERAKAEERAPTRLPSLEPPEPQKRGKSATKDSSPNIDNRESAPMEQEDLKSVNSKGPDAPPRRGKSVPKEVEEVSMTREDSVPKEEDSLRLESTPAKLPVEENVKSNEEEPKKKNKKKKGRVVEPAGFSSADETKEVETKTRKKKGKQKEVKEEKVEKEPRPKPEVEKDPFDDDFPLLGGREDRKKSPPKNIMDASISEPKYDTENDNEDDSEQFYIRERSSSVDSERFENAVNPYSAKPQQSAWLNGMLRRGTSLIETQIVGALQKYEDTDDKGSEDDEMHEFEKNTEDTGEHSPHLLEEEEEEEIKENVKDEKEKDTEEDMIVTEQITSRLTELLQLDDEDEKIHEKETAEEDDFFLPVSSKRNKKKQRNIMEDSATDFEGWKEAESGEHEDDDFAEAKPETKDGWSFEVDEVEVDVEVNKLLSNSEIERRKAQSEERTPLEDVFRFDSEMIEEQEGEIHGKIIKGKRVSVEDLSDALRDETDSEAETGGVKRYETSTDDESMSCGDKPALSSSYPGTSSASEGSTTNSPNVRATKSKGKKSKKKKR